jgi:enoyl-CoA hydratase
MNVESDSMKQAIGISDEQNNPATPDAAQPERRNFLLGLGAGGAAVGVLAALPAAGALAAGAETPKPSSAERRRALIAKEPRAITYESSNGIALITINRPEQKNALSIGTLEMLHDAWVRYNKSDDRCAVLTGKGNDYFCNGGMPEDMTVASFAEELITFWRGIPGHAVKLNKPLIGALAGQVHGGGFTLAMMTDMLVAAENTVFAYPEAQFSTAGGLIGPLAVRIPHKVAMQIMLTGQPLSVQRAYEVGLVNEVVPVGKQVEAAMKHARHIADAGPLVIAWFKSLVDRTLPKAPGELAAGMLGEFQNLLDSEDIAEFVGSLREGRQHKPFLGK